MDQLLDNRPDPAAVAAWQDIQGRGQAASAIADYIGALAL